MLRRIALVCCFVPMSAYALYCPTNSKFVEVGQTAREIWRICGKPTSIEKIDDSIIISALWTYTKNEADRTIITKLKMDHGYITSMTESVMCKPSADAQNCLPVTDETLYIFTTCYQYIYVGSNIPWVEKYCGPPASKKTLEADYHVTEEYYYANTAMPSTLVLLNGKLIDSK